MRGIPRFPLCCKGCGERNAAHKDHMCHACRLRSRPNAKKKFFWNSDLDARLRDSYTRASRRDELTASLNSLQRVSGFPRWIILSRAADLGLSFENRRHWTDGELHFIRNNAGRRSIKSVASRLGRTYYSVKAKIRSLELPGRVTDGYSVDELARTFGVGKLTIDRWIARGWIARVDGRIPEASIRRFLRTQPHQYQLRRVDEVWFKQLVFPHVDRKRNAMTDPQPGSS